MKITNDIDEKDCIGKEVTVRTRNAQFRGVLKKSTGKWICLAHPTMTLGLEHSTLNRDVQVPGDRWIPWDSVILSTLVNT